jgi:hypothetical protein
MGRWNKNKKWKYNTSGFDSRQGQKFFSSPSRPDRLWSQPNLITKGYRRGLSSRDVKLITHPHLAPRLRMRGNITPLPNTSSWHVASLSNQGVFMAWYFVKHRYNFTRCSLEQAAHSKSLAYDINFDLDKYIHKR